MTLLRFLSGFIFCLMAFVVFMVIGMFISGLSGAGDGQGLAAGAIVVGYGMMVGLGGILLAIILLKKLSWEVIKKINIGLGVLMLVIAAALYYRISTQIEELKEETLPKEVTAPAADAVMTPTTFYTGEASPEMSMGFFAPDFYKEGTFYFYGKPTHGKSVTDQVAWDSIVFQHSDMHQYEIAYAPPFLNPSHLKLDYELLYFSLRSEGRDYAEIVLNEADGRTAYIDKFKGKIVYWEPFILSVHSVELKKEFPQEYKVKPLDHASTIAVEKKYNLLRPETVQGYWLEVTLLGEDFNDEGRAWIKWRDEHRLLVKYSLLS
jgi:hypothetical protein